MKKIFTLLLFVCALNSRAQIYYPFPTDSATWTVDFIYPGNIFIPPSYVPYLYYLDGDSIVNGVTYHKIYSTINQIPNPSAQLSGIIREQNKIVYCIHSNQTSLPGEIQLYNFNLQVNDTFHTTGIWGQIDFLVNSIDSELTSTGYRKAYNLGLVNGQAPYGVYFMRWVEGIGDIMNNPIYPDVPWVDVGCQTLCYNKNSIAVWPVPQVNCWFTGIEDLTQYNGVSIFNNPSDDKIILKFKSDNLKNKNIVVFDTSGKEVLRMNSIDRECLITKEFLRAGMYFVKIKSEDEFLKTFVIVFY